MRVDLTRPGVLPTTLLESSTWNTEAVRKISFDDPTWRAIIVTDETGPVGAVCYSEPSISAQITVDAVVMHPERRSPQQWAAVVEAALPMLRSAAVRFRAKRIVWEAVAPELCSVLYGYGARDESVTLSMGIEASEPVVLEKVAAPLEGLTAPCGRVCASHAGVSAHARHCEKCKEVA